MRIDIENDQRLGGYRLVLRTNAVTEIVAEGIKTPDEARRLANQEARRMGVSVINRAAAA